MNININRGDWIVKNSNEAYENPWITVRHHDVITPGGTKGIYGEVNFKNIAIGIIPIDEDGYTWRVGQFSRAPARRLARPITRRTSARMALMLVLRRRVR